MGTGMETEAEARRVAEMGTGTMITRTGTRIGSGRAEVRQRSARDCTRVINAMWEKGAT